MRELKRKETHENRLRLQCKEKMDKRIRNSYRFADFGMKIIIQNWRFDPVKQSMKILLLDL